MCVQMSQYKGQACYCADRVVTTFYASYVCTKGAGFKFSIGKTFYVRFQASVKTWMRTALF